MQHFNDSSADGRLRESNVLSETNDQISGVKLRRLLLKFRKQHWLSFYQKNSLGRVRVRTMQSDKG